MSLEHETERNSNYDAWILGGIGLVILAMMALYGGKPTDDTVPMAVFYAGVVIFGLITLGFGWAAWHLLFRPLPDGHAEPNYDLVSQRTLRVVAVIQAIAGFFLVVGGMWDELWHRMYGVPFGEDFFWRPHLMMYAGFLVALLLGGWGWYVIMTQGKGTLQQRFRANKLFGMIVMIGTFMIYALPADPIWHEIYGEDLTAWSIPHVVLVAVFLLIILSAAAIHLSLLPKVKAWRLPHRLNIHDVFIVGLCAILHSTVLMLMITDWDVLNFRTGAELAQSAGALLPTWLLPTFLVFVSAFSGIIANRALKLVGASTLVGLMSLGFRLLMLQAISTEIATAGGWMMSLFPLIGIDLWYVLATRRSQRAAWWGAALGAAIGMIVALPIMNQFFVLPEVTLSTAPGMALGSLLAASMAAWMSDLIGVYLGRANKADIAETDTATSIAWMTPAALIAAIGFAAWFIATATPPVL